MLWIIISSVESISGRKKNPPPQVPPNDSTNFTFEMPTLANDPNKPAEVQEVNLVELYRQKKQAAQKSAPPKTENNFFVEEETKNVEVDITAASAINAIILSEILDKPKALRKKKF